MAQEQDPAKKVAKRVVRKTVKRPAAKTPAPTIRYGRPTLTTSKTKPSPKSTPPKKATAPKPARDLGKKAEAAGKAFGRQAGKAATAAVVGIKGAAGKVGSSTSAAFGQARAYRIPRMDQTKAAAIVGLLVGLITVGIAALFAMAFSELRGTSTGGGRWGSLTVVVVAFIAFAVGELLLARLHVLQPRVTSFLGVCLTLLAILVFFLDVVNGAWAWLIVPLLGAGTYAIAHRAIAAADSSGTQPE